MLNNSATTSQTKKVIILFGTRPEAIKLAPVIFELKNHPDFQTVVVSSSQHTDLLKPFLRIFEITVDYDLRVMTDNQTPNSVCAKVLQGLDAIFDREKPDLILVQGDTTTAFAGAFAGFNRRIAVGHVEAGLRSGNLYSPFPEEMNRRLITQAATFHFAATENNCVVLQREGIGENQIFLTGNTVVDALHFVLDHTNPSAKIDTLLGQTEGFKRILLTTHRRESFGDKMSGNLLELKRFVKEQTDTCLIFPVHPNPNVRKITNEILAGQERVFLLEPLDYIDFTALMKAAWLITSDSGGVQEEAPSLGKPLLILRENTERPEAVESGVAKLVGENSLFEMLKANYTDQNWINSVRQIPNPFGDGKAARRIVSVISEQLSVSRSNGRSSKQFVISS
jgi:UDP-N-acetylglucosamine 2-epimerase (non-hydrolysing)